MRLTGGPGKGGWHDDQTTIAHGPIQLRKAEVVTDRQTNFATGGVERDDIGTAGDRACFIECFIALRKTKQMYFVVANNLLAGGVVDQRGISNFTDVGCLHRHRAADQPDTVLTRHRCHAILNRPAIALFGNCDFVRLCHAHDWPVFGQ